MSKVDLIIQSGSTILYPIVEEGISLSWDRKGAPGKLKFSVVKPMRRFFKRSSPA